MKITLYALLFSLLLVSAVTGMASLLYPRLGPSGLAMGYLLLILMVSIYATYRVALFTGMLSFLALNFFFVEPRYTFQVGSAQALLELIAFGAVAMTTASLTTKLKAQTQQAQQAKRHVQSAQALAEELLKLTQTEAVLARGVAVVADALQARVMVTQVVERQASVVVDSRPGVPCVMDLSATHWCTTEQQAIGPYTGNWQAFNYWCLPLQAQASRRLALFVEPAHPQTMSMAQLAFVQGLVDQINLALGLLVAREQERVALSLAERESVQNALLASLSHDFRTPLTAIIGAATTLLTRSSAPLASDQLLLSTIVDEATQMVDDAENILSLIHMETNGTSAVHADWQSVEELVGVVVARCRRRHPHATLVTQVEANLPLIYVDARLVTQALVNLVENALKFDPSGLPIGVQVAQQAAWMIITVRDHGAGLPVNQQTDFKAKFVRGRSESAQPGFGLGLSICEAVAQVHGGRLALTNAPEGGLCASLYVPIASVPAVV